ncbi:hypothetical protein WOLCODRAFT_24673 [Wolfiporia cocos MD-104 SS10]|uniref:MARVEL domain-containing protein n=1 Tax=Wolfiporia cocos (strain MD-104) TaxID=742152 RepID=A0A2H3JX78_WOLCO|nr:hypothetical protein WOLCODRAFT_24673 [Wolfiporia cocos MD-104 SS10]
MNGGYFTFAGLGIATSVLTVITVPAMLVVDLLNTGFFSSMILVELIWFFILWVLFLATGGSAADSLSNYNDQCTFIYAVVNNGCYDVQAVQAFAFLTWIFLMAYNVALLVIAIINWQRGNPIWTSSVKESFTGSKFPSLYPMTSKPAADVPTAPASQELKPIAQDGASPV